AVGLRLGHFVGALALGFLDALQGLPFASRGVENALLEIGRARGEAAGAKPRDRRRLARCPRCRRRSRRRRSGPRGGRLRPVDDTVDVGVGGPGRGATGGRTAADRIYAGTRRHIGGWQRNAIPICVLVYPLLLGWIIRDARVAAVWSFLPRPALALCLVVVIP